MAELTVICPTMGRPKNARRLALAFRETCTADTRLVFAVNDNDTQLSRYYAVLNGIGSVMTVTPGRRGMCDALNFAYENLEHELGFAVGFMGDDHLPRSTAWDSQLLEALHAGSLFAYGNDLLQGEAMATEWVQQTRAARALGFMVPPGFQHLCVDLVVRDWGRALGSITYLEETVVEHLHPLAGKAVDDNHYKAVNSSAVANHDAAEYHRYNDSGDFAADVEKLRALL